MRQQPGLSPSISRRSLLVIALSGVAGCGGGGSGGSSLAASPGTGGTGLFAQGSITGFGSVILNAIRFDDTSAAVQIDGLNASSLDLRLGMVAQVQGQRGADLTLGVANRIEVWSIAQGVVSEVQAGQFKVAGMLVQTDAATVLDGISAPSALSNGMRVVVWGLQSGADGNRWTATRIALVSAATPLVSTGIVTASTTLNGLALTGQKATGLVAGQLVRVQGVLSSSGGSLQVDSAKVLDLQSGNLPQGDAEIEGLVTALLSGSRFMLGNVEVDASSASLAASYRALALGQRIEVEGVWQGRVLKAVLFEVENEQKLDGAEIEAKIEQFTSLDNFVVRGQRCNASTAKISKGVAGDLKVGVKVKLTGTKAGDVLMVATLEIEN